MKLIRLFAVLIVVLVGVSLVHTNRLVGQGETMRKLQAEIEKLEYENRKLEKEIATFSSLTSVHPRITELGFAEPESISTLKSPAPIALRP